MGCGKSSVGRRLSELLCCPFMDLDSVIEEREGRSIPEIFATDGEAAFRRMEKEALLSVIAQPVDSFGPRHCFAQAPPSRGWQNANSVHQADAPTMQYCLENPEGEEHLVMALGGGTVMTRECAEMVHKKTLCIYLRASVDTLLAHLAGETDGRPMLQAAPLGVIPSEGDAEVENSPLRLRIEDLMAKRAATYENTAHMIIDTDGRSIEDIAVMCLP